MNPLLLCVVLLCSIVVVIAQKECPNAPAEPQDRRVDKTKLTIATYNAEWLFLNRSNCPGSGCTWKTLEDAKIHMADVAKELEIINAALAEVQDCSVLIQLNMILAARGMGYQPYLVTGTDTSTGQNVALLTRVDPIVNLRRTENRVTYPIPGTKLSGTYGVSKHYFTTFNIAGLSKPLTIFGMHFLAFPDDLIRCVQREAQASVIKQLVAEALQMGHSVVVTGDLNDFDNTVLDASNNVPITSVLDLLRDPLPSLGDELSNVAKFVALAEERYSCWYDRDANCNVDNDELSMIDHVLISSDLLPLVAGAYMDHSYGATCGGYESDHWPSLVQLNL